MRGFFLGLFAVFLTPIVLIYGVIAAAWLIVISPILIVGTVVWLLIKDSKMITRVFKPGVTAEKTASNHGKTRKPITISFKGNRIPLGVYIISVITSVLFVVLFIFGVIFWFPIWFSILVIGFLVGKSIGKRV